ncbi:MAG: hypothetical protein ACTSY1_07110 [Alphaproteobacteria bacterium]
MPGIEKNIVGARSVRLKRRIVQAAMQMVVALALLTPVWAANGAEPLTNLQFVTISSDIDALPKPVAKMWDTIAAAAATGDIEAMRLVFESSELLPQVARGDARHPIEILKSRSVDGSGRDIAAAMLNILEAGYAHINQGKAHELYIWPYFAATGVGDLAPQAQISLYRIAPASAVAAMLKSGQYSGYRLGISPDGTWQYFLESPPRKTNEQQK